MSVSPNLGLMLTTETDDPTFKSWRNGLAGDSSGSNMMIIDGAVGDIQEKITVLVIWANSQPVTQEEGCVWNEILP